MFQSFKNQFLISLPALKGDYFQSTISLIIEHNEHGAFGLIINQVLKHNISELFKELGNRFDGDDNYPILIGGPVEQSQAFFLHPNGYESESTLSISPEFSLTTSVDILKSIQAGNGPEKMLTILGYAGWGAGQLEAELFENIWLIAPSKANIIFDMPYQERAGAAAAILGIDLNLMPTHAGGD